MLSDIALLATALGIFAAVAQLVLSRRQARAEFEQEFVKRYWEISDDGLRDRARDDVHRKRYLRLCEDEYEVMRLGSVSWRTWEVWHDAIREECSGDRGQLADLDWLAMCLKTDHRGAECPALFAPGSGTHSGHLSARWPSSLSRRWFIAATAVRRRIYERRMARPSSSP